MLSSCRGGLGLLVPGACSRVLVIQEYLHPISETKIFFWAIENGELNWAT